MQHDSFRRIACGLLLVSLTSPAAAQSVPNDAVRKYLLHAAQKPCAAGAAITLDVPLTAETEVAYDVATGRLRVFYPMQFNDLTEGWNWHPEEVTAGRDYYTYKYLPLGSTHEARGSYLTTDPAGQPLEYPIRWRWDYFFAFDNPYDFYPRDAGAAAGFAAEFFVTVADAERLRRGDLRMSLSGRLHTDCHTESTTFWKATISAPVDFTLKKRYLVGQLEEIRFIDAHNGAVLTHHAASPAISPSSAAR